MIMAKKVTKKQAKHSEPKIQKIKTFKKNDHGKKNCDRKQPKNSEAKKNIHQVSQMEKTTLKMSPGKNKTKRFSCFHT